MKISNRKICAGVLVILALLCVGFSRGFLQGGARSGFVFSYIAFVAVGSLAVATAFPRWQTWISVCALAGLVGPTLALVLIVGAEGGALNAESQLFRTLASLMAVLWYPGNWVSSLFGMEVRLSDLHLTRSDELYEWLRLVPLNALVYGLVGLAARGVVARLPIRRWV